MIREHASPKDQRQRSRRREKVNEGMRWVGPLKLLCSDEMRSPGERRGKSEIIEIEGRGPGS